MKLKPVNDKIVVKAVQKENEERTAGGIILPDTVKDGGLEEGKVIRELNTKYKDVKY